MKVPKFEPMFVGVLSAVSAMALVACSSSGGSKPQSSSATPNTGAASTPNAGATATASTGAASTSNTGAAALVPANIRSRGSVTFATDSTFTPYGFLAKDGKTVEGIDADTGRALAPLLGVKVNMVNASFDSFIPGLKAGRYDAGFNAITDNAERRKVVDFLNFEKYGNNFLTPPDSKLHITGFTSVCDTTVGAETGSDVLPIYKALEPKCRAAGKQPPKVKFYGSQAAALVAMTSGRVDAVLGGTEAGYLAKHSNGKYVVNGPELPNITGSGFLIGGMALAKGSPMAPALVAALTVLWKNGTLAKIHEKYGLPGSMVIKPSLDTGGGTTPFVR